MILSRLSSTPCLIALIALMQLVGCAVGPDFKKPTAPQVSSYTSDTLTHLTGKEGQRLVTGQDISAQWWKLFESRPLNELIERALKANPTLKAAQAALTVAHENALSQNGAYYPSLGANFAAQRQKTSQVIAPVPNSNVFIYNLYTPQVSVSYTPDVFGPNRRTVESLKAQEEQARFALVATNITLSANVVTAAIAEASLREQIDATRQIIAVNTDMLRLLRNQLAKGSTSRLDVSAQESQLAQVSATLPPLITQLAQQRDLLAVLAGGLPGDGLPAEFTLASLKLPNTLPLSIPSRLIEQRPDVRQAEENLHAASAQIGIAIANRLPNITLTADAGAMALAASQMFTNGTGFWTLAGNVAQPLFDGGILLHKERAARAAFIQASEQYHSAVLTAFQNVADTLNALNQDASAVKTALAAKNSASATLELTKRQLQSGSANYLSVLSAQQAYRQATISLVQAQATRFSDTAALFQALGGGWWNSPDMAQGQEKAPAPPAAKLH